MRTIDELETEYLQLRHAREHGSGKFLYDVDFKWRAETERALVAFVTARDAAAKPAPVPNADDLALLQRATAVDKGRHYFNSQQMRERIFAEQVKVLAGERIDPGVRAATEAHIAELEKV